MNCSDNYDCSNAIGNGEVDSSILSGSTIYSHKSTISPEAVVSRSFDLKAFPGSRELFAALR
jgi:hypothetical protein